MVQRLWRDVNLTDVLKVAVDPLPLIAVREALVKILGWKCSGRDLRADRSR